MMTDRYEAVIGLEVHAELKTETKIFCSCSCAFGAPPNTNVCPICGGMPGALPVLNRRAVHYAVRAALALGCRIHLLSRFDRKNYYYPDLPKGFQITQYFHPIAEDGRVRMETSAGERFVGLERIHLEEDAGKLIHRDDGTLIDCNRCGVPLIEIVTKPDLRTPEEAKAYLNALRRILRGMGVSDCRMNEGSLRCDVNVSLRLRGEEGYGVKCEVKNLNSVHAVGRALEAEIARQSAILDEGGTVEPETRRFNENTGKTERMRRKETVIDYRYFPEPNIPPILLTEDYVAEVKRQMPKMPDVAAEELEREFGVRHTDAVLLTADPAITAYYRACVAKTLYKSQCTSLFIGEILGQMDEDSVREILPPEHLAEIADLFGEGKIVSGVAKRLIHASAETGENPLTIAKREGLMKITDPHILRSLAQRAVEASPKAVADYRRGKTAAAKQMLGWVMRETAGGADPVATEAILLEILAEE